MKRVVWCFAVLLSAAVPALGATVGMVEAPSPCSRIDRIEENRVYLLDDGKCTAEGDGELSVTIKSDYPELELLVNGKPWKKIAMAAFSGSTLKAVQKRAEQDAEKYKVELPDPAGKMAQRAGSLAQETSDLVHSPEYVERIAQERGRALQSVYPELDQYYRDGRAAVLNDSGDKPVAKGRMDPDQRVYIFISSSMPMADIKGYLADVAALGEENVRVVMRGLVPPVEGMVGMANFSYEAERIDPSCDDSDNSCARYNVPIAIDPKLFARYDIDQVPAIVYAEGVDHQLFDQSEGDRGLVQVGDYWALYGTVPLETALRQIAEAAPRSRAVKVLKEIGALPGHKSWYSK